MTSLRALLASAGFHGQGLDTAVAVAMAESGGHPTSHNTNAGTGDNSYGLFQINMLGSLGPARMQQYHLSSYDELFDPTVNAHVAYQLSQGGTNWTPWTTYTRGTYQQYLGEDMQIDGGLPDPNAGSPDPSGDLGASGPPHSDTFDISDGQSLTELSGHQAELHAELDYAVGAGPLPKHMLHPVTPTDMSSMHTTDPAEMAASAMPSSMHPGDALDSAGADPLGADPLGGHSQSDGQSTGLGHGLGATSDMQEGLDFDEHYLGWDAGHH
jgi:lysozyme-like protein